MLSKETLSIIEDIKSIKIQGARNIAKAILKTIMIEIKNSKDQKELLNKIKEIRKLALETRVTEPMAKNLIEVTTRHMMSYSTLSQKEALERLINDTEKIMNELDHYYKKMIKNAADHLPDGSIVITICHSSSVTGALKKAYEDGKEIKVISCETRPLYQGRITTRELAEAGIEVTHIIDSEAATYIKKCDSAFVGADAVNAEGDLYNKVGTRMLAELCSYYRVPFHPIMELLKFDPLTILGYTEVIEQRDPKEIWDNPPKNVKVLNPAFDHVPASLIKSYITEEGLLHPFEIKSAFEKKYKMVFDN